MYTDDFGRHWLPAQTDSKFFADVSIAESGFGVAAAGDLLVTKDFGRTWRTVATVVSAFSVGAKNDFACAACEGGLLLVTRDRGTTWNRIEVPVNGLPSAVSFDVTNRCMVLFLGVIPDTTVSENDIRMRAYQIWESSFGVDDPVGNWVDAERQLSGRSTLLVSDDAFQAWTEDHSVDHLKAVAFGVSGNNVMLIGENGNVYLRTETNGEWELRNTAIPANPFAVWPLSDDVWVAPAGYGLVLT